MALKKFTKKPLSLPQLLAIVLIHAHSMYRKDHNKKKKIIMHLGVYTSKKKTFFDEYYETLASDTSFMEY